VKTRGLAFAALALCACKPSSSSSSAMTGSGSSVAASQPQPTAPAQPAAPKPPALVDAPAPSTAPEPLDAKAALAELPALNAAPVIAPVATADGRQVHGTWCLPGTGADGVMRDLAASLTTAGWSNVTTRGDATKAGVSGERDGYRASYVVSASTANQCRAPGHYFASLTMFRMK
jgi:hypothetical protein